MSDNQVGYSLREAHVRIAQLEAVLQSAGKLRERFAEQQEDRIAKLETQVKRCQDERDAWADYEDPRITQLEAVVERVRDLAEAGLLIGPHELLAILNRNAEQTP